MTLLPDFVIVGAQKSGSTVMAENLRQHPGIYMPPGETHCFRDPEYLREPWTDELEAQFSGSTGGLRRGIKCPDYLGQEACAQRIATHLGMVDIIAILRNPVERALSHYYWLVRWGQLPVEPADVGIRRILNGDYDGVRWANKLLEFGLYGEHLERYLGIFGAARVLVLLDGDLRRDAAAAAAAAYGFLGIDPGFQPHAAKRDRNEGIYRLSRLRFVRLRNRFVYDNGDPMTGTMRRPRRAHQALPNAAIVLADRYLLAPFLGNEKPPLDPAVERELREFYAEDVKKTEELIDRDLSAWR